MANIGILTERDVESRMRSSTKPVVIDFYQASCPPCRMLEPRLERVAARHHGVVPVYRVDIDRDLPVAERFGVMSLPTVIVVQNGREVQRLDGLITEHDVAATFERIVAHTPARANASASGDAASQVGGS
ncbi:MAG: thioredoxin family protein [Gemmatimonadaceae bacterium]